MEVFVYALSSESTGEIYVGISKFVEKRVRQHDRGESVGTRGKGPWHEVLRECYGSYAEAREREKFLKTGRGREWLRGFLAGDASDRGDAE